MSNWRHGYPPAGQTAPELLAIPLVTDHDVLARVSALIEPARMGTLTARMVRARRRIAASFTVRVV